MPDFTSVFTQERDHWQGRAEAAEAEVERARATISEMLDENNRLDAERDQAMREVERLRGALDGLATRWENAGTFCTLTGRPQFEDCVAELRDVLRGEN